MAFYPALLFGIFLLTSFTASLETHGRAPIYCHANTLDAKTKASSSWSGWGPRHAIQRRTWSTAQLRLNHRKHASCASALTKECPQFIRVDLAEPVELKYVQFSSYNHHSAPVKFEILGARDGEELETLRHVTRRRKNKRLHRDSRFPIPQRNYRSIMIKIYEIKASAYRNWYYATISDLILC